jgi:hypothetical protein
MLRLVSDQGVPVLLADFGDAASVADALLPAGDIVLQVAARNALGGTSLAPATALVTASEKRFVNITDQQAFFASFAATTAAATLAPVAAMARAATAADLLNAPDSPIASDPVAAAAVRTVLLQAIQAAAAAAAAATPEVLASAAVAVTSLVGNATQVNAAGAEAALSMLSAFSGARKKVSNETSTAVAIGLSSIAEAAQMPASGMNRSAVLLEVTHIVSSLADSLFAQLSDPGAPPLTVWAPSIQLSVAVDLVGPQSRLFSQPGLSAPGSGSAFAPMPAGLLDGAGDVSGGVRTQFCTFTFDPFAPDADSTGVTQLTFFSTNTNSNSELPVADLVVPIRFTLPPVPALQAAPAGGGPGLKSQCAWWDASAAAYSTAGCVALPDPAPPGAPPSWVTGFAAGSDSDMARAWNVTGALADGCEVRVLDCGTQADAAAIVYPDPTNPLTVPSVACPLRIASDGAATATSAGPRPVLRVYVGARCALWRQGNAANCSWDNTKQAFTGAGCVPSGGHVQCACRHVRSFMLSQPCCHQLLCIDALALPTRWRRS